MNAGHDGEELKCCMQPLSHWEDPLQTKFMVSTGYRQEEIKDLLRTMRTPWSPACSWVLFHPRRYSSGSLPAQSSGGFSNLPFPSFTA